MTGGEVEVVDLVKEFNEVVNSHIQTIFPQLVVTQIQNSLAVRQILPKGPAERAT